MLNAKQKVERLADILDRHREDRIIVFTAYTDLVYRLAERFLIPAITHETPTSERREILRAFRSGAYSRIVTANVLDEGVDVPDANVTVVLSRGWLGTDVHPASREPRPTDRPSLRLLPSV
jgi:superfamily II DNA or RNA helicase